MCRIKCWERKGWNIDITEQDKEILRKGTVDYAAFSYYMSNADYNFCDQEDTTSNPYLKTSDWGWPIDPLGLRYSLNLIYVNKNNAGEGDLSRSKKKSFFWYKEVIASNGGNL